MQTSDLTTKKKERLNKLEGLLLLLKLMKNQNKYSIEPIPGFDIEKFPFLVCSGESSFNLFSVKDYYMELLVNAATSAMHAQTAFFFDKENGSLTMHFTTTRANDENQTL